MKKYLFLVIAAITVVSLAYSRDILPVIEEGNEYTYSEHGFWYKANHTLKLTGDSIYNGKTYKKCVWHSIKEYDDDDDGIYELRKDTTYTNGLVREENGKVWMLYNAKRDLSYWYGSSKDEFLIYDMNLNEGEDLQTVPDSWDPEYGNPGFIWWHREGKHKLVEKSYVNIKGIDRLVQKFAIQYTNAYDDRVWRYVDVIEGIGVYSCFLIFPYNVVETSGSVDLPTLIEKKNAKGEIEFKLEWAAGINNLNYEPLKVYGRNSEIIIEGDYSSYSVTDISGRSWNTLKVPAGLYIVTVDGRPHKILVK